MNNKLLTILIVILLGQTIIFAQGGTSATERTTRKICSPIIEGLQFCVTSRYLSVTSGEDVFLPVTLQNMSDKPLSVNNGYLPYSYFMSITNSRKEKILSRQENLESKVAEGKVSRDELVKALPINGIPRSILLEPKQELKGSLPLSNFFEVKEKGIYLIKLTRKVPKNSWTEFIELPLDPIEVEIK